MTNYKFIIDNNCRNAAQFFPSRRIVSLERAGLSPNASDRQIVEVASERQWIIVTANGDDFIDEIKRYLRQSMKLACHDLHGLVIIPNDYQLQQYCLPRLDQRLQYKGKHIGWKDVWELDCCVRVTKKGKAQITRFDRCFYCNKNGLD